MRAPALLTRFRTSADAIVAVEFAVAMPVLLVLLMVGLQVVLYVNATRKVELLATSVSEMISQAAPPTGSSTATVNYIDLHFGTDSALVIFPYVMRDAARQGITWSEDISVNVASVKFDPKTIFGIPIPCPATGDKSSCYKANVVWTTPGATGSDNRACYKLQQPMDDTAVPNKLYIPRSIFGPGSIIVVDIVYTFTPSFGANLIPSLRIARSVYVQPRYATLIDFDTSGNDGIGKKC